jgi:hypothetical protein
MDIGTIQISVLCQSLSSRFSPPPSGVSLHRGFASLVPHHVLCGFALRRFRAGVFASGLCKPRPSSRPLWVCPASFFGRRSLLRGFASLVSHRVLCGFALRVFGRGSLLGGFMPSPSGRRGGRLSGVLPPPSGVSLLRGFARLVPHRVLCGSALRRFRAGGYVNAVIRRGFGGKCLRFFFARVSGRGFNQAVWR